MSNIFDDFDTITIKKNVPPPAKKRARSSKWRAFVRQLEVGDLIENIPRSCLGSVNVAFAKEFGPKTMLYESYENENGKPMIRVWRKG